MEYTIVPYSNDRIFYVNIAGDINIDDWIAICQDIYNHVKPQPNTTHLIFNMLDLNKHPHNLIQIKRGTVWASLPNLEWVVNISQSRFINILGTLVMEAYGKHYHQVESLEEALRFLSEHDLSL